MIIGRNRMQTHRGSFPLRYQMWHHGVAMKSTPVFTSILRVALAGLMLAGGCSKQNPQSSNNASTPTASQPSVPAPPPDQTGAAPPPATSPSSNAPATAPGAAPAQNAAAPPPVAPAPLVIPAGTHVAVTLQETVGSKISQPGETFAATLARPIVVDGQTVVHSGARVTGTVVDAKPLGRFKGGAYLELRLDSIHAQGQSYEISTNALERVEQGKGKRTAGFIGGGAGLGAIIGGIAGGGKGALIGGLAGGGAGTAGAGLTGKKDIVIPAETTLTFRLRRSVQVSQ
jgi:hypothetical protein